MGWRGGWRIPGKETYAPGRTHPKVTPNELHPCLILLVWVEPVTFFQNMAKVMGYHSYGYVTSYKTPPQETGAGVSPAGPEEVGGRGRGSGGQKLWGDLQKLRVAPGGSQQEKRVQWDCSLSPTTAKNGILEPREIGRGPQAPEGNAAPADTLRP